MMMVETEIGLLNFNGCFINDDDEPEYCLEITHIDGYNYKVFSSSDRAVIVALMRDLLNAYDRGRRKYSIVANWTATGKNKPAPAEVLYLKDNNNAGA